MKKIYKTILLDCDGVVLDSNDIKTNAFKKTLENEPKKLVNKFIENHKENQGIDRYKKFEYFFLEIKKSDMNYEKKYFDYLKKYSSLCKTSLLNAKPVPGILNFLEYTKGLTNIKKFIVSGSDHDELNYIFNKKKLSNYFDGIYGSPKSKKNIIKNLIEENKISKPAVFFGDAKSDMMAALDYNIDFIYIYGFSNWLEGKKICNLKKIITLKDFESVTEVIGFSQ